LSEAGICYLSEGGARDANTDVEESIAVERTLRSLGYLETPKSGDRTHLIGFAITPIQKGGFW
jgi:hypothetical protein